MVYLIVLKEIHGLLEIELWNTVLISISNWFALKVESKDMAKKYPIKMAVVRNTRDAFNSQCKQSFFVWTLYLTWKLEKVWMLLRKYEFIIFNNVTPKLNLACLSSNQFKLEVFLLSLALLMKFLLFRFSLDLEKLEAYSVSQDMNYRIHVCLEKLKISWRIFSFSKWHVLRGRV